MKKIKYLLKEKFEIFRNCMIIIFLINMFIIFSGESVLAAPKCGRCGSQYIYYNAVGDEMQYYCDFCGFRWKTAGGDEEIVLPCEHRFGRAQFYNSTHHIRKCEYGCKAYTEEVHTYYGGKCACGRKTDGSCEHDFTGDWESDDYMHKRYCLNGCGTSVEGKHSYDSVTGMCVCGRNIKGECVHDFENGKIVGVQKAYHKVSCYYGCGEIAQKDHTYNEFGVCQKCGYRFAGSEKCKMNNPISGHPIIYEYIKTGSESDHYQREYCQLCKEYVSKKKSVPHNFTYTFDDSKHYSICSDCGKEVSKKHSIVKNYEPIDENTHILIETCKANCGFKKETPENHSKGNQCSKCKMVLKCSKKGIVASHESAKYAVYQASSSKKQHYVTYYCGICNVAVSNKLSEDHNFSIKIVGRDTHTKICSAENCGIQITEKHTTKTEYIDLDSTYHFIRTTFLCCEQEGTEVERGFHSPNKNGECSACGRQITMAEIVIPEKLIDDKLVTEVNGEKVIELWEGEELDISELNFGDIFNLKSTRPGNAEFGSDGVIVAKKEGSSIITIKVNGEVVETIKVVVKKETASITGESVRVRDGHTGMVPLDQDKLSDKAKVVYESNYPEYVQVNPDGSYKVIKNPPNGETINVKITATITLANGKTQKKGYTVAVTSNENYYYDVYTNDDARVSLIAPTVESSANTGELPGLTLFFGGDDTLTYDVDVDNGRARENRYIKGPGEDGVQYNSYVANVQCTGEDHDSYSAILTGRDMVAVIKQLASEGKIDPKKVRIVGFSRGGYAMDALLEVALDNPDIHIEEAIYLDAASQDREKTYRASMANGTNISVYASNVDPRGISDSSRKVVDKLSGTEGFYGREMDGNHAYVGRSDETIEILDALANGTYSIHSNY